MATTKKPAAKKPAAKKVAPAKKASKNQNVEEDVSKLDIPDKNQLFDDFLTSIEDKWMEKDVVNSYVRECGGILNFVTFRFIDEAEGYYFECELEIENLDSFPDDIEQKILNEIEWAFDGISEELKSEGLDLDSYLGEKLLLTKVN